MKIDVKDVAKACHEVNRAYCASIGDSSQLSWDEAPDWQKSSAERGVQFHLMNPKSSPRDSHQNWLEEKKAAGWKYGLVKDAEKKEHPCCVEFEELPKDQQTKDHLFLAVVRALE